MKRRLMASILALIMAVGLLPAAALAQDPEDDTGSGAEQVNLVLVDGQSNAAGEAGTLDGAKVAMPESGEAFLWQDGGLVDLNEAVTAKVEGGSGQSIGFYPALAKELNEQTGCRTVIIHLGHNGAPISYWASQKYTQSAVNAVSACLDYLSENGYEVAHSGYVWLQGESDSCINSISGAPYCGYTTLDEYYGAYMDIHDAYIDALGDGAVGGIITVQTRQQLNSGVGRNSEYCGVRAAQQALANQNADLIIASEITDGWRANKNSEYFSSSGGPIHYSQTGYDLIGADAGANLAEAWNGGDDVEYFQLVGYDGVTVYDEDERIAVADNMLETGDQNESESGAAQLVVKTYPLYADCDGVTMTLTDAAGRTVSGVIDDNGYIADAGDIVGEMTLTVSAGGIEQSYVLLGEGTPDDGSGDYYWDLTDGAVSVTEDGWTENRLTENILQSVTYYAMDTAAVLPSDGEWTIEWKGTSPASCVVLANNDDERDESGKGAEYIYVANNSGEADKTELFFVQSGNANSTNIRLSDIPDDVKTADDAVWYMIHNGEGDLTLAVYGNGKLIETTLEDVIDMDYSYNGIRGYFTTSMPIGYNGTLEYVKIYHTAARLPGEVTEITGTVDVAVTAPATGEEPDTSVTGTNFTGEVAWPPEAETAFAAETVYTATVTLMADDGYVFAEDAEFTVSGGDIESVTVSEDGASAVITVVFPATAKIFNDPSDEDFYWDFTTAVADGLTVPSVSGNGWKSNALTFNGTAFDLNGENGVSGSSGDRSEYFAMEYPASLPADGAWTVEWGGKMSAASMVFSDNRLSTGTLPGDGAHFHMWYDGNGVMNLRVSDGSTVLTLDTHEYSGKDAVWYVVNDGEGNLTLAACYNGKWLTAEKDGALTGDYVIDSLMGIYRTDMGFDYVGSMRYMKIYHTAAVVGVNVIETAQADIEAPESFAQPQTEVAGTNFTGEVVWSPEAEDAFAAGTVYTATVTLMADEGYVFAEDTEFTVPGGDIKDVTVSKDGASAVLTVVFPATAKIDSENDYYWDFTDGAVSVTGDGWTENELTEEQHKGIAYYSMDTAVLLPRDEAWTIEWKGTSPASCVVLANNDDERDGSTKGAEYIYVANNSGAADKTELFFVQSGNAGSTSIRLSDIPDDVKKADDAVWYITHNGEGDLTLAVYGNGKLIETTLEGVIDRDYSYNAVKGYYSTEYPIGYNGTLKYMKIYHAAAELPVAVMNGVLYGSLSAAVEAAETASYPDTPDTASVITLLKDTVGGFDVGVETGSLETFKTRNITLDLNGFTLTLGYPEVGSGSTKTNGIRVLAYSALTVRNGVIENGEGIHAASDILQNYGTAVLEDVEFTNVDAADNTIGNFGSLELKGNTVVPSAGESAIINETYLYSDDSQVPYRLIIADETVTVGDIMLDLSEYTHPQTGTVNKADPELKISAGSIDSIAFKGSDKTLTGGVSGGSFAVRVPDELCAEGYVPTETPDANGKYTVVVPYTVTFDARGGKVDPSSALTNGAYTLSSLPEPTRRNYYFTGWYTESRGGEKVTVSTVFEGDTTIYAHWLRDDDADDDGSYGEPAYSVTLPGKVKNGSVKSSAAAASEGATVTVTAEPDEGYELGSLTVTDADGRELKLTDRGNGRYSFTMPDSAVRVAVSFVKAETYVRFEDVPADAYFADAVKWAVDDGVTTGMTDTLFGPYEKCTRGQIVTFLWRAAGSPEPESRESAFTDLDVNAYYYKAVLWAVENGITEGMTADRFAPDAVCTRAQSVTFLYRAVGEKVSRSALFSDVDADAFYADAVDWAVDRGVTRGTSDTTFSPDESCLRAEIVTFLYRAYMEQ